MRHELPVEQLGAMGPGMAEAIQACVHCGFCLPTCPTYVELGQEADSPRGRILLMKEVLEGTLEPEAAQPHIDRCLGCLACETACPSGVSYGHLVSPYRALVGKKVSKTWIQRLKRWLVFATLPHPSRLRWALRLAAGTRWLQPLTPKALRPMLRMVPPRLPKQVTLPEFSPAQGERRGRVALVAGCAQQVLSPEINEATIRVLTRNGFDVVVPRHQACCGALAWHVGEPEKARHTARALMRSMPTDADAVISNAAGCGSGMHEYSTLFAGEPDEAEAVRFSSLVTDISVWLTKAGFVTPDPVSPVRVGYHDACHLAHAQRVRSAPRSLLQGIPGITLIELQESELCCGSAGTYNIDQPDIAAELGLRKATRVREADVRILAAANIGCLVQIRQHLDALGHETEVSHPIVLLDRAYRGESLIRGALESSKA
ncbi:MAG: glycolate oxidase subunit GlcF [Planctomycetales bacterium]|nr:glycolate oxidase subunit GlcF [Planctomycetales bacterium]